MRESTMSHELNHRHRETVERLFQHPMSHNIEWRDVESLLEAIGECEWSHDDRVHVTIGDARHVFIRPKTKEVDADMIVDLRHLLTAAGYAPEK
jgi:hypothetical protein